MSHNILRCNTGKGFRACYLIDNEVLLSVSINEYVSDPLTLQGPYPSSGAYPLPEGLRCLGLGNREAPGRCSRPVFKMGPICVTIFIAGTREKVFMF